MAAAAEGNKLESVIWNNAANPEKRLGMPWLLREGLGDALNEGNPLRVLIPEDPAQINAKVMLQPFIAKLAELEKAKKDAAFTEALKKWLSLARKEFVAAIKTLIVQLNEEKALFLEAEEQQKPFHAVEIKKEPVDPSTHAQVPPAQPITPTLQQQQLPPPTKHLARSILDNDIPVCINSAVAAKRSRNSACARSVLDIDYDDDDDDDDNVKAARRRRRMNVAYTNDIIMSPPPLPGESYAHHGNSSTDDGNNSSYSRNYNDPQATLMRFANDGMQQYHNAYAASPLAYM